jgi:hypothetical protein
MRGLLTGPFCPDHSEDKGHYHAQNTNLCSDPSDFLQLANACFQFNGEQQQNRANSGQHLKWLIDFDPTQHCRSDHTSGCDFSHHSGQFQALRDFSTNLCGYENDEETE